MSDENKPDELVIKITFDEAMKRNVELLKKRMGEPDYADIAKIAITRALENLVYVGDIADRLRRGMHYNINSLASPKVGDTWTSFIDQYGPAHVIMYVFDNGSLAVLSTNAIIDEVICGNGGTFDEKGNIRNLAELNKLIRVMTPEQFKAVVYDTSKENQSQCWTYWCNVLGTKYLYGKLAKVWANGDGIATYVSLMSPSELFDCIAACSPDDFMSI